MNTECIINVFIKINKQQKLHNFINTRKTPIHDDEKATEGWKRERERVSVGDIRIKVKFIANYNWNFLPLCV